MKHLTSQSKSLIGSFYDRSSKDKGLVQLLVGVDCGVFEIPQMSCPLDEYVLHLVYLCFTNFSNIRWEMIHNGGRAKYLMSYEEFQAQLGYMIESRYLERAWSDYTVIYEELYAHWSRLGLPDIIHPAIFEQQGNFYVIEVRFEVH